MSRVSAEQIKEAIENFDFQGTYVEDMPWGNGHINDTFLLVFEEAARRKMQKRLFIECESSAFSSNALAAASDSAKSFSALAKNIYNGPPRFPLAVLI